MCNVCALNETFWNIILDVSDGHIINSVQVKSNQIVKSTRYNFFKFYVLYS